MTPKAHKGRPASAGSQPPLAKSASPSRGKSKNGRRRRSRVGLWSLETQFHGSGHLRVAGVDEVGRGPLAGPVVAAAVIFPPGKRISGLADSKVLTARQREELYAKIVSRAAAVGVGMVSVAEIDQLNIGEASREAMRRALADLGCRPDMLLVDGPPLTKVDLRQEAVQGGDARCACVAAASIIAKVTRDRLMIELDRQYPGYGFGRHKGYGSREHLNALARLGPSPEHRRTFAPVAFWRQISLGLEVSARSPQARRKPRS
jgi:ribonuclease HII